MTALDDRLRDWADDLDAALPVLDEHAVLAEIEGRAPARVRTRRRLVLVIAAAVLAAAGVMVVQQISAPEVEIDPVAPEFDVHPWSQGEWPPAEPASVGGWVKVPGDVVGDPEGTATLAATSWRGGFVRLLGGGDLRASRDGVLWHALDLPAPPPFTALAMTSDARGRVVVAGHSPEGGPSAWRTSDGRTWEPLDLPDDVAAEKFPFWAFRSDTSGIVVSYSIEEQDGGFGAWRLDGDRFVEFELPPGRPRLGSDGASLLALAGPEGIDPYRLDGATWERLPALPVTPGGETFVNWIGGTDGHPVVSLQGRGRVLFLDGDEWIEPVVEGAPPAIGGDGPDYAALNVITVGGDRHIVGGVLRDPNTVTSHDFAVWAERDGGFEPAIAPDSAVRDSMWMTIEFPWSMPTFEGVTIVPSMRFDGPIWVHRQVTRDLPDPEPPRPGSGGCSAADEPIDVQLPLEPWQDPSMTATREQLARAAATCDFETLASLAAPGFLGEDGEPVSDVARYLEELDRTWDAGEVDPAPILALRRLVELPPVEPHWGEPFGVAHAWPYLAGLAPGSPLDGPWAVEELVRSGLYDRETLVGWIRSVPGDASAGTIVPYFGWRVTLDAEGRWSGLTRGLVPLPEAPSP